MPATLDDIGIQSSAESLVESLDYGVEIEDVLIKETDGTFGAAHAFDPKKTFSIKGYGSLPAGIALGTGDSPISEITGGVTIITSVKTGNTNENFDTWECSGDNYPGAS